MYELHKRDVDNVVKEEIEENEMHLQIEKTSSVVKTCDLLSTDDLPSILDVTTNKENVPIDQEVKYGKNINTTSTTVKPLNDIIKIEIQDAGESEKDTYRIIKESEIKTSAPETIAKEKKNKLIHKRKLDNKIAKNIDKKKKVCIKKSKHKKYEKPSDQVLKHYQCSLCPKVFQRSSNFNAHQRTHNPLSARPYSCQDCKNTFHYRCQLRDHARIHTGERPFTCHSCNKTFARKGCLVAHMVTHSDSLPFQCDICCKRFARKYNLAKHVQSHSGDRPYRCLNCSRRFKCKQSLDKHHRIHELNIYSCVICQESFDSKRRLTHHKINEHVSYRPFTCQICHKPFIFKSQLTYHIKEHNLERPYSCGKCNKSYFKKGHLLSHIKQYCSDFVPVPQVKIEVIP